ncbi:hypothetical protein [Variovorax rhizosphaerae]|uniref:Uncharacterized protein n=1 Tax=Variovorax rhizosphaerae TaxID=1836200 RepID=A0ABU8WSD7_9BURK
MPSPDFSDPDVREQYEAARRTAQAEAFVNRVRCGATTRLGIQCGHAVAPGRAFCWCHGGRRLADFIDPKDRLGRAKQQPLAQRAERQHAARMKALWRSDAFIAGFTVLLDAEGVRRRDEWLRANGIEPTHMAPAILDKASWKSYQLARSGIDMLADVRAQVVADRLRQEDEALIEPAGHHADMTRASEQAAWRKTLRPAPAGSKWRSPLDRKPVRVLSMEDRQHARDVALLASEPQTRAEALQRELARNRLHAKGAV